LNSIQRIDVRGLRLTMRAVELPRMLHLMLEFRNCKRLNVYKTPASGLIKASTLWQRRDYLPH